MLLEDVEELAVALGPQRLAQEVGAVREGILGRGLLRGGGADGEELGAHAVHVAHEVVAGHRRQRRREAHDDVGVRRDDDVVHQLGERRLELGRAPPRRVEQAVLQVVGVRDADDVVEGVRPARPVVVPVDVLGLLEDDDVALGLGDLLDDVAVALQHAADELLVLGREPADLEPLDVGDVGAVLEPPAHVHLLLRRPLEAQPRREEPLLVGGRREPRHVQRHVVAGARQVGGAQERVDRGARHPRQRGGGHDVEVPAGRAQVGRRRRHEHRVRRVVRAAQPERVGPRRRPVARGAAAAAADERDGAGGGPREDRVGDVRAHLGERALLGQLLPRRDAELLRHRLQLLLGVPPALLGERQLVLDLRRDVGDDRLDLGQPRAHLLRPREEARLAVGARRVGPAQPAHAHAELPLRLKQLDRALPILALLLDDVLDVAHHEAHVLLRLLDQKVHLLLPVGAQLTQRALERAPATAHALRARLDLVEDVLAQPGERLEDERLPLLEPLLPL